MSDAVYYEKPALLHRDTHRHRKVAASTSFAFAAKANSLALAGLLADATPRWQALADEIGGADLLQDHMAHAITPAAGPAIGVTCTSLAKPAVANAADIAAPVNPAASRSSHQANTLGPAPEMLAFGVDWLESRFGR